MAAQYIRSFSVLSSCIYIVFRSSFLHVLRIVDSCMVAVVVFDRSVAKKKN